MLLYYKILDIGCYKNNKNEKIKKNFIHNIYH